MCMNLCVCVHEFVCAVVGCAFVALGLRHALQTTEGLWVRQATFDRCFVFPIQQRTSELTSLRNERPAAVLERCAGNNSW